MHPLLRQYKKFLRAQRGVALLEFAFVFPIVMLMLLGALEVSRAIIITQRVEKVGYVIADITTQYLPATADRVSGEINETELNNAVFPQFSRMMGTYADTSRQAIILTSVRKDSGVIRVKWQAAGGGSRSAGVSSVVNGLPPSAIGRNVQDQPASFSGEAATLLSGMSDDENMIVAEVFYFYQPIWTRVLNVVAAEMNPGDNFSIGRPRLLTKRMYFRPRTGDLLCLPDTFTYPECEPPPPPPPPGTGSTCTYATAVCDEQRNPPNNKCCRGIPDDEPFTLSPCVKDCEWVRNNQQCQNGPC